jgi:H/ACA ribonucleoprotein complex subunit 4
MAELRRTRTGPFREDANFITLYDLVDAFQFWQEDKDDRFLRQYVRPLEEGVQHLAHIIIRDTAVDAICHGANLAVIGVLQLHADIKPGDPVAIMTLKGELVALATALMSTKQVLEATSGIVADTARVVLSAGTYPTAWRRKS